jgi:hypothetical protein
MERRYAELVEFGVPLVPYETQSAMVKSAAELLKVFFRMDCSDRWPVRLNEWVLALPDDGPYSTRKMSLNQGDFNFLAEHLFSAEWQVDPRKLFGFQRFKKLCRMQCGHEQSNHVDFLPALLRGKDKDVESSILQHLDGDFADDAQGNAQAFCTECMNFSTSRSSKYCVWSEKNGHILKIGVHAKNADGKEDYRGDAITVSPELNFAHDDHPLSDTDMRGVWRLYAVSLYGTVDAKEYKEDSCGRYTTLTYTTLLIYTTHRSVLLADQHVLRSRSQTMVPHAEQNGRYDGNAHATCRGYTPGNNQGLPSCVLPSLGYCARRWDEWESAGEHGGC